MNKIKPNDATIFIYGEKKKLVHFVLLIEVPGKINNCIFETRERNFLNNSEGMQFTPLKVM